MRRGSQIHRRPEDRRWYPRGIRAGKPTKENWLRKLSDCPETTVSLIWGTAGDVSEHCWTSQQWHPSFRDTYSGTIPNVTTSSQNLGMWQLSLVVALSCTEEFRDIFIVRCAFQERGCWYNDAGLRSHRAGPLPGQRGKPCSLCSIPRNL
jgi:hypothetical protein